MSFAHLISWFMRVFDGYCSQLRRPAGEVIARFEDCVFGKRVEIVFAINEFPYALHDHSEERIESFKTFVLGFCHKSLLDVQRGHLKPTVSSIGRASLKRHALLVRGFSDRNSVVPWLAFPEL